MRTVQEIIEKLENLYGGPRNWPASITIRGEASEEYAVDVWNEAIKAAIDIITEGV